MYFITTKRMLEVCFSTHPNIQYRTKKYKSNDAKLKQKNPPAKQICRRI